MAKLKGRDVMLDLLDTVAELERNSVEHTRQFEELSTLAIQMAARAAAMEARVNHFAERSNQLAGTVNQLAGTVNQLAGTVNQLATQVGQLRSEVTFLTTEVSALSGDTNQFAQQLVETTQLTRDNQLAIGRLSRLLGQMHGDADTRFGRLEHRVTALEKKSA